MRCGTCVFWPVLAGHQFILRALRVDDLGPRILERFEHLSGRLYDYTALVYRKSLALDWQPNISSLYTSYYWVKHLS